MGANRFTGETISSTAGLFIMGAATLAITSGTANTPGTFRIPVSIYNDYPHGSNDSIFRDVHFAPTHRLIGDRFEEVHQTYISKELESVDALLNIGNILFKDGRDLSEEETKAINLYIEEEFMDA
jgi:hypothetical protein